MTEPEESLEFWQLRAQLTAANDTIQLLVNHPDQNNGTLNLHQPSPHARYVGCTSMTTCTSN
ncbi:hypothetical protein [Weissella cibaria]|uniref:Uncharacterized protein n=1 Tax=Weissella cibaria TaxID=137591 RepID=A0A0D1JLW8_9LACO|nr:hypothetical protein [Weissella cibaria]ALI33303.1 hypothetical protein AO080_07585 [Weissella cibaria]KIU22298.1 hypothetical protein QX99_00265 [Weissella cibaria]MBD1503113.1 hypothetical protein [Weissella cibaria]MDV8930660.1 hypothetical protein [Weissella cibaria]MDY2519490.1 hypothetical protein [Weissella cibaria]